MRLTNKIKRLFTREKLSEERLPNKTSNLLEETSNIDDFLMEEQGRSFIPLPLDCYNDEFFAEQWNYSINSIKIAKDTNFSSSEDCKLKYNLISKYIS
jgi:membrane-bound lytic murein transglycosylase